MFLSVNFSGRSNGDIIVHESTSLETISILNAHSDVITDLKFSNNRKYFASCDVSGHTFIWVWSTLKPIINCNDKNECIIAWHPWKEEYIVVGAYCRYSALFALFLNLIDRNYSSGEASFDQHDN